jgi:hypothetical protein
MIAATRIPTHRNDGKAVCEREITSILQRVRRMFNGYSFESPSVGAWVAIDGKVYEEESRKLEVVVSRERVGQAKALFMRIGKQLGQRAIFFEGERAARSSILNEGIGA